MDISVSQLNLRLALQLPAELPLGLVFVSGSVGLIRYGVYGRVDEAVFVLEEGSYHLQCRLERVDVERLHLQEGDEVRLGGHLAFDYYDATYYLRARDIELVDSLVVEEDPLDVDLQNFLAENEELTAVLTGIKRRSVVAANAPGSMPDWVQKIAPPEVQTEFAEGMDEDNQITETAVSATVITLNNDALSFLSQAMDSDEDVILTPDILAQWVSEIVEDNPILDEDIVHPYDPVTADGGKMDNPHAIRSSATRRKAAASQRVDTDWLVIILIVVFIILAVAVLILSFILALQ
jgi:hypothetical protein